MFPSVRLCFISLQQLQQVPRVFFSKEPAQPSTTILPRGSALGPFLFYLYISPLGKINCSSGIHFHCYAADPGVSELADASVVSGLVEDSSNSGLSDAPLGPSQPSPGLADAGMFVPGSLLFPGSLLLCLFFCLPCVVAFLGIVWIWT